MSVVLAFLIVVFVAALIGALCARGKSDEDEDQ